MGLTKLIDGFEKDGSELLWYTIAHPSLAWEEEKIFIEKNCYL
jgi:hypothetical protein